MYTPPFNQVTDDAEIRAMVAAIGSAWLVTVTDGAPQATLLPIVWRGDTVSAHIAKANPHWKAIEPDTSALLICGGPETYVSPSWYASKAEHGRVVPTWNYSAVQLAGRVRVHHDPEWLRAAVTDLADVHESSRDEPWQVSDAPERYVAGQLKGVVGIEVTITRVTGKTKLSQNRSEADQRGVIDGLRGEANPSSHAVADQMAAASSGPRTENP